MLKELGWLSVPDRLNYNNAHLTYRVINNMLPEYISNLLKPMSVADTLNIQSSAYGLLYVPKVRTALYESSFPVLHQGYVMLFLKRSKQKVLSQLLTVYFRSILIIGIS